MNRSISAGLLPAFLKNAVSGEGELPAVSNWLDLLDFACFHDTEALICRALRNIHNDVPKEVRARLQYNYRRAVFLDIQQDYTAKRLQEALSRNRIPHVLLRGAVLKRYYPEQWLRTMSDLDYLVHVEDYPAVRKVVEELGGRHVHTDGGHFSFLLPPQVLVEFHPSLIYTAAPVGTAINPGWQYVRPDSGPWELELTEEGFYLNMVCHLAYHFAKGGTGVRSVLDLWVYRNRHRPQPDQAFIKRELERAGLWEFVVLVEALAEVWFGEGNMTPLLEELGRYILTSGAHGVEQRAVLNAACFSPGGTGASALLYRAFYPRAELENRFPWTRRRTWLLPVAWFIRAAQAVSRHSNHILRWGKRAGNLSRKEIQKQQELLRRFALL